MSPNPHSKPKEIGVPPIIPPPSVKVDTEDITVPRMPAPDVDPHPEPSNGCYKIREPTCCTKFFIRGTDPSCPEMYSQPFKRPLEMNFPRLGKEVHSNRDMEELGPDGVPLAEIVPEARPSNPRMYSVPLVTPYRFNFGPKVPENDVFIEDSEVDLVTEMPHEYDPNMNLDFNLCPDVNFDQGAMVQMD